MKKAEKVHLFSSLNLSSGLNLVKFFFVEIALYTGKSESAARRLRVPRVSIDLFAEALAAPSIRMNRFFGNLDEY